MENKKLIPVKDWESYYGYPSQSGLRYLIFNADNNGFHSVIRRIGRRVLISVPDFIEWVEKQNYRESENE